MWPHERRLNQGAEGAANAAQATGQVATKHGDEDQEAASVVVSVWRTLRDSERFCEVRVRSESLAGDSIS